MVCTIDEGIALSLTELASRFPIRAGPYCWIFQLLSDGGSRDTLSFVMGWT